MSTFDAAWSSADLSKAVCDALVAAGRLKEKPAFIRTDRETKITKVFEAAPIDGAKMGELNARGVEVLIRNATQGEAWVDDVQNALKAMLSDEAKADTKIEESAEMKELRQKIVDNAKIEFADGAPPPDPAGPGGRSGGGGGRECYNCGKEGHQSRDCPEPRQQGGGGGNRGGDDEAYGSFGGQGGGGGRECYNCGQQGHMSRDCPEPRNGGGGGGNRGDDEAYGSFGGDRGAGFGGGGGGRECYNCGKEGHQSRDCPEPRQGGGGGGGGRECYNCGKEGHQSRDCPEPRRGGY